MRRCANHRRAIWNTILHHWKSVQNQISIKKIKKKGKQVKYNIPDLPDGVKMEYIKGYVKEKIRKRNMLIKEYKNSPLYNSRDRKNDVYQMFPLEFTYEDITAQLKANMTQKRLSMRKSKYKHL